MTKSAISILKRATKAHVDRTTLTESEYQFLFEAIKTLTQATSSQTFEYYEAFKEEWQNALSYKEYSRVDSHQAFNMGACWAALSIAEELLKEPTTQEEDASRQRKCDSQKDLLRIIYDNPGISHGDLAKEAGKSVSRLSQILHNLEPFDLISIQPMGRNKYYYLNDFSKRILASEETAKKEPHTGNTISVNDFTVRIIRHQQNQLPHDRVPQPKITNDFVNAMQM